MTDRITSVAGLKKAIGEIEMPTSSFMRDTFEATKNDVLSLIVEFEASVRGRMKELDDEKDIGYLVHVFSFVDLVRVRAKELRRVLEGEG